VGLTMKSMDYWEASLPVINNIRGDTWEMMQCNFMGINYVRGEKLPIEKLQAIQENRKNVRAVFDRHFSAVAFHQRLDEIMELLKA